MTVYEMVFCLSQHITFHTAGCLPHLAVSEQHQQSVSVAISSFGLKVVLTTVNITAKVAVVFYGFL